MNRPGLSILLGLLVLPVGSPVVADPPSVDLLRGPDVDRAAKESNLGMLENGVFLRSLRRTAVAPKRWFIEYESLSLTPGQLERISALKATFNLRSQAYLDRYQPRIKELRKRIKGLEASTKGGDRSLEHQELLVERARLLADAPQVTELQQSAWSLLTPDQQDSLRSRLEVVRDEIRRQQAIERLKEQSTPFPEGMQEGMQEGMSSVDPAPPGQPGRLPSSLEGFD